MTVLFWGLGMFISGLLIHFVIWRIKPPKKQTNFLLAIFFFVFIFSCAYWKFSNYFFSNINLLVPDTINDYISTNLLYISLVLAYIISYSAVEADSPSLSIILSIHKQKGISESDLKNSLSNDLLVLPRISDLLRDNLIYRSGEKYELSKFGKLFILVFLTYKKTLKTEKGG